MKIHVKLLLVLIPILLLFNACNRTKYKPFIKEIRSYDSILDSISNLHEYDYILIVDLKQHSGKYRMFLFDKEKRNYGHFLCLHGKKSGDTTATEYSNEIKSNMSSQGLYSVSREDYDSSNYGSKFNLKGLDSTDNNAEKRLVVLHPSKYVRNKEIYPKKSARSFGCPAVSEDAFRYIKSKIKGKKTYLYIL